MKWCAATGQPWHKTCARIGTKQHWPKRSQGGKKVAQHICWPLHDAIDNGMRLDGRRLENEVVEGVYTVRDRDTKEVLLEVPALR